MHIIIIKGLYSNEKRRTKLKIRVISVKDKSNYLIKMIILILIVLVLSKFFYSNRNAKASILFNSAKYKEIMNKEISLISYTSKYSSPNQSNFKLLSEKNGFDILYANKIINDEINLISEVNSNSVFDKNRQISQSGQNINSENDSQQTAQTQSGENNDDSIQNTSEENLLQVSQNNISNDITEPEVRPKHRSFTVKHS